MDSILNTVKKALGVDSDYHVYDTNIIAIINDTILGLSKIGVGPTEPFVVVDDTETWKDYLGDNESLAEIQSHICLQVMGIFNPLGIGSELEDDPNSILNTVKKILGVGLDTAFDTDIVTHINSVFLTLNQIGVGPTNVFSIKSKAEVWSDFIGDAVDLEAVKSYIYLSVRILFDPPTSSAVLDAMTRQIAVMEFRLMVQEEPPLEEDEEEGDDDDW